MQYIYNVPIVCLNTVNCLIQSFLNREFSTKLPKGPSKFYNYLNLVIY